MKMEHRLIASGPGVIGRVLISVGDSVDHQQVLIEIEESGSCESSA
jgi:biotin carboxyl carrier protein